MTTIPTDVANDTGFSEETAADEFLAHFDVKSDEDAPEKKKKVPSEESDGEVDETSDTEETNEEGADEADDSDESPEEEAEDEPEAKTKEKDKRYVDSDDAYVKVKVGEDDHDVKVSDLKRLFGQEASLTRKAQEAAETRKTADAEIGKTVLTLDVLLKRAQEKNAPYAAIDWLALAKNPDVSAEDASALRAEAQRAHEDVAFLQTELNGFYTAIDAKQKADRATNAKACITALSDPGTAEKPNPVHIKGWNEKAYDELRTFGVSMGIPQDTINNLTDPAAFKMMHMAMLYKRGASKVLTIKTNKTPKKIVKTSSSSSAIRQANDAPAKGKALTRLKAEGTQEAAADAFFAGMADRD